VLGTGFDTLMGGAAAVQIQSLGKGDVVSLRTQTGKATDQRGGRNIAVTLGGAANGVWRRRRHRQSRLGEPIRRRNRGARRSVSVGGPNHHGSTLSAAGVDTLIGGAAACRSRAWARAMWSLCRAERQCDDQRDFREHRGTPGAGAATCMARCDTVIWDRSANTLTERRAGKDRCRSGGTDIIIGSSWRQPDRVRHPDRRARRGRSRVGQGRCGQLCAQSGNATINAVAGNIAVTLGAGAATVYGGAGDTVISARGANMPTNRGGMKIRGRVGRDRYIIGRRCPAPATLNRGAAA